jgi:hypothetical protein
MVAVTGFMRPPPRPEPSVAKDGYDRNHSCRNSLDLKKECVSPELNGQPECNGWLTTMQKANPAKRRWGVAGDGCGRERTAASGGQLTAREETAIRLS